MFAKIALLCFAAFVVVQAGSSTSRVLGGHEAVKGQFPFLLSLKYDYPSRHSHLCSATILNPRWALTAAHCIRHVKRKPFAFFYVTAGLHSLKDVGQRIRVKRTIVHPEYEGFTNPNDLALLELDSELVFGDNIKTVELPEKDAIPSGESTLPGWGSTNIGWLPNTPAKLQTVDLTVISYEECSAALIDLTGTDEPLSEAKNMCTGSLEGKQGACSGDSGSPLITKDSNVLIGVVSGGMLPCGRKPSIYIKVSAFSDWINHYIQ